jgi:hypothetical protein
MNGGSDPSGFDALSGACLPQSPFQPFTPAPQAPAGDHRGLRDERHDPHRAGALRARERVDLEDLLQQCRPAAGGVGGGQPRRSHDRHGRIGSGGRLA